jgi:hypothetical protein
MKLISFRHHEDFGHEWYVQILHNKRWALLQASVSWNDFPGWPYIQIKSGTGSALSIMFWAYKFGFDIGFIEYTWNWERLEEIDEDETELV